MKPRWNTLAAVLLWMLVSAISAGSETRTVVCDIYTENPFSLSMQSNNAAFDEYMRRHPNVKIQPGTRLSVPGAAWRSGKLMGVIGGTAPDVWSMYFHESMKYSEQGLMVPLNSYIGEDRNGDGKLSDDEITYEPWKHIPKEFKIACMQGDTIYALPYYNGSLQVISYRRDFFRQAGLDPDVCPKHWDELYRLAQILTYKPNEVPGKERGQAGLQLSSGSVLGFNPLIWSSGGELVRKYKTNPKNGNIVEASMLETIDRDPATGDDLRGVRERWRAAFDSEQGRAAMRFFHKLRWQRWVKDPDTGKPFDLTREMLDSGTAVSPYTGKKFKLTGEGPEGNVYVGVLLVNNSSGEEDVSITRLLAEGRAAMFLGYRASTIAIIEQYGLAPAQFGFFPMPTAPGVPSCSNRQPGILAISRKKNRTKEEEREAWNVIRFFLSEESERLRTAVLVDGGKGELVPPDFLKAAGYLDIYQSLPESWRNIEGRISKFHTEPFNNGWSEVQMETTPNITGRIFEDEHADIDALLAEGARDANAKFEGWTENELKRWRPLAWLLVFCALALFLSGIFFIVRNMTPKVRRVEGLSQRKSFLRTYSLFALALPAVCAVLLWQYYPLLRGSVMAFQDYKISGNHQYVGVDNFIMLFGSADFYLSMLRTFYYVGLTILIGFVTPIFLAFLLTEIPRFKILFRTIFYLPAVTSSLVIMFLWKEFYDPSPSGLLNTVIIKAASLLGIETVGFKYLSDPRLAMLCIILPAVWAAAGSGSLIYQAALTSIPPDMYEAAELDGAGFFAKIRYVTIPMLKPLIIINFVGVFIGAFHAMQNIFVLTGGGPYNATRVIGLDIWYNAFVYLKFGMATAMAWVLGLMLIGFTVMQLRILSKVEFRKAQGN